MLREKIANTSKNGKLNRDLHQPYGIRYVSRYFSVRCLVSLAYGKGLISAITLSVVVPQAIGIFLCNRIGDDTGDFPSSVVILHTCPCIKHRYVPLLGTSLFSPWHSSPPRFVAIKNFYFFKLFKTSEKVQKIKTPKSQTGKDVIFGSSWVMLPSNRALCITYVGWVISLTLGDVLFTMSLSPLIGYASSPRGASVDASCVIEMSQFAYQVHGTYLQSPFALCSCLKEVEA